jgi:cystathionine beta-lyase
MTPKDQFDPRFDPVIERRGTHCVKWDMMEPLFGVPAGDGIAMWVADMDFRPPPCVLDAVRGMLDHGIIGYFGDDRRYREAIRWWMRERHGWEVDPRAICSTHGLVNGTAMCVDIWTAPGDGVVLFTPVYHAFAKVIRANGRRVVECELARTEEGYVPDFPAWDEVIERQGARMAILCSPHNPNGRVWTERELAGFAALARRHDLVLVSDEIHHDLVYPGHRHVPMTRIDGVADRLVMMTAPTKTFNIAGCHTGQVIVEDEALRAAFEGRMAGLGLTPNSFGLHMTTAAYSPDGAAWVDALMRYLDGNRKLWDAAVDAIPGLRSVRLEATYLAWVDFAGTGMAREEFTRRVERDARIAVNHGPAFGKGGETFLRFNLAMPRARVEEAAERLAAAFADLQ